MTPIAPPSRRFRWLNTARGGVVLAAALALGGCQVVSRSGPLTSAVISGGKSKGDQAADYSLVDFSETVADTLAHSAAPSLNASFGAQSPPPRQELSAGDVLDVAIFESAPGGLFSAPQEGVTTGSQQVNLPKLVVDQAGYVAIPYAGKFRAAGLAPSELARAVEKGLARRAIEPQVVISAVDTTGNSATVLGAVTKTGRIKLSITGDRILTVLANAGISGSETETVVRLVRQGAVQTVPLTTLVNAPQENVFVFPGDTIFVLNEPQVFNALGAVSKPGQYPIRFSRQTVAGAIALSGGLSDSTANAGGVFMFRFVAPDVARKLIPGNAPLPETAAGVPIVFRIRFSDPRSFFWLQQAQINNGDLIYVANSISVELQKFVNLASQITLVGLRASQTQKALQ